MGQYNHAVFSSLNSFEKARELLPVYKPKLSEIGVLLCQHGLEKQLAVCLLHKHFELDPNERLVKDFVEDGAVVLPTMLSSELKLIPYVWKFDFASDVQGFNYRPLEFLRLDEKTERFQRASRIFEHWPAFLTEASEYLQAHGLESIFGFSLLHVDAIGEDEVWLEETNSRNRTIKLSAGPREHGIVGITETNWTFTLDKTRLCESCLNKFNPRAGDGDEEKPSQEPDSEPAKQPQPDTTRKDKPWKDKSWKDKPWKNIPKKQPRTPEVQPEPTIMCTVHCHRHCHGHCHVHCNSHCHTHCPPHRPDSV